MAFDTDFCRWIRLKQRWLYGKWKRESDRRDNPADIMPTPTPVRDILDRGRYSPSRSNAPSRSQPPPPTGERFITRQRPITARPTTSHPRSRPNTQPDWDDSRSPTGQSLPRSSQSQHDVDNIDRVEDPRTQTPEW